jgi:hypothetical protein
MTEGDQLALAEQAVWRTARVLEQRRFRHHFQAPDRNGVLAALDVYRTEDGGYGFALEPDGRGPVSQPLHVEFALRILADIDAITSDIGDRICGYLVPITRRDGGLPGVHASIAPYPKAPWWAVDEQDTGSLIPTAAIAGPLLAAGIGHPWLAGATGFCWARIEEVADGAATHPYEIENALSFLDGVPADRDRARELAGRLGTRVRDERWVTLRPDHPDDVVLPPGYGPGEFHCVHDYAPTPHALARQWFTDAEFAAGLDWLAGSQRQDGCWTVRWRDWCPAATAEWRGWATVQALLTLRTFGRLA